MSWHDSGREETTIYKVVVNDEEQYSIWPEHKENPLGWREMGKIGDKVACLAYIKEVWTDMRPLSLRKRMEEVAKDSSATPLRDPNSLREKRLVDRLCEGEHPIEVGLHPDRTVELLKEAVARDYVHIKFTETKGGTELGVRLDRAACDFANADFERSTGTIHIEGGLMLDYVKVRCIADFDLVTLSGKGYLVKVEAKA